jgi:hypothetical protein
VRMLVWMRMRMRMRMLWQLQGLMAMGSGRRDRGAATALVEPGWSSRVRDAAFGTARRAR